MPSFSRKVHLCVKYSLIIMQIIQLVHGIILLFHWTINGLTADRVEGNFNPMFGIALAAIGVSLACYGLPVAYREQVTRLWLYSAGSAFAIALYLIIFYCWTWPRPSSFWMLERESRANRTRSSLASMRNETRSLYDSTVWMSDATRMILAWMLILTIKDQDDDYY